MNTFTGKTSTGNAQQGAGAAGADHSAASAQTRSFHCDAALLPEGWARDVRFDVRDGRIVQVQTGVVAPDAAVHRGGIFLPGMINLHSHAFQRAMAGRTEFRGNPDDSFWTWRELMYRFAAHLTPDQTLAIARWLYIDMLKAGFTHVCEFHYLHHDVQGQPFADPAEMSWRIFAAAADAGIGLTHLPVLYRHGGFGPAPAKPGQQRFLHDNTAFARLLAQLAPAAKAKGVQLGIAPHSLRAVTAADLQAALLALDEVNAGAPIHIHIAEQNAEVRDCIAQYGARPVQWLLDHFSVDARWCLVHATHLDHREVQALATSGAVAGLCITTEANLGDGFFPITAFRDAGGRFGIGSDSHVSVSVVEELRWLEYGVRLQAQQRALLDDRHQSCGGWLYQQAAIGGAQAAGVTKGALAVGHSADFLVLDTQHPRLQDLPAARVLDSFVFSADPGMIESVWCAGTQQVQHGVHRGEDAARTAFVSAMRALQQAAG